MLSLLSIIFVIMGTIVFIIGMIYNTNDHLAQSFSGTRPDLDREKVLAIAMRAITVIGALLAIVGALIGVIHHLQNG